MNASPQGHHCEYDPCERFELLSLYLDNEACAEERRLVEKWIDGDAEFRRLYQQQLLLQRSLVSAPSRDVADSEAVMRGVMATLDRRDRQRRWWWGGWATAAAIATALGSSFLSGAIPSHRFNMASNQVRMPTNAERLAAEEPLAIAMERPLVPLPKGIAEDVRFTSSAP